MNALKWLTGGAISVVALAAASACWAGTVTVSTSTNPIDNWRVIAPDGNQAGRPLSDVGLAWEGAHAGWNTSLAFDDSAAAGWHAPVARDVSLFGGTSTNNIWSDGADGRSGRTPAYFRLEFELDGVPTAAFFGSALAGDYRNVIDDDAQIYLNGHLVFDDRDGVATFLPVTDVTAYLRRGPNLLAVKAQDSFGGYEHFSMVLSVATRVPEPPTVLLLSTVLAGLAGWRRIRASLGR